LDLSEASTLLEPLGLNGFNLSYYVCEAYLMRVAMHQADYAGAITHAEKIIDANAFSLANSPMAAFNNAANSTEDIFAIQQSEANNSGNISTGTGIVNFYSSLTNQGVGAMRVSSFYLTNPFGDFEWSPEFAPADLRGRVDETATASSTADDINAAFYTSVVNTGVISPAKFMASDRVIPVIRYAEILLTRAEALQFSNPGTVNGTALADYNAIRNRAGLSSLDAVDFTNGVQMYDSILLERRREFLYEGVIFHDMKRRGESLDGDEVGGSAFILPVPQSELDAGAGDGASQ
jgi:hypothetical protein